MGAQEPQQAPTVAKENMGQVFCPLLYGSSLLLFALEHHGTLGS